MIPGAAFILRVVSRVSVLLIAEGFWNLEVLSRLCVSQLTLRTPPPAWDDHFPWGLRPWGSENSPLSACPFWVNLFLILVKPLPVSQALEFWPQTWSSSFRQILMTFKLSARIISNWRKRVSLASGVEESVGRHFHPLVPVTQWFSTCSAVI